MAESRHYVKPHLVETIHISRKHQFPALVVYSVYTAGLGKIDINVGLIHFLPFCPVRSHG